MAYEYRMVTTLNGQLPYPHYSNELWDTFQMVYGQPKGKNQADSDRLWQWDWKKADEAAKAIKEAGLDMRTPRGIQAWLTAYHGRPCRLTGIGAQTNRSNGYTVWSYWWDEVEAGDPLLDKPAQPAKPKRPTRKEFYERARAFGVGDGFDYRWQKDAEDEWNW